MKQLILILMLCFSYHAAMMSQNLDSMSVAKRDSLLIATAKEAVLKYGPDYYREYIPPVISKGKYPPKGPNNSDGKNAGRDYYQVTFLYDKAEEELSCDFAAKVRIWANTGCLYDVIFSNGWGREPKEGSDWRNDTSIKPVRYEQKRVFPIYDYNDPNRRIKNLDELKQKGYVEQSDGQWVKTTPDVPPGKRNK